MLDLWWYDFEERKQLWDYIKKSVDIFNIPWMCIGDFNEVKENEEKDGVWRTGRKINSFRDFINDCELMEVPYKGQLYTWFNKKGNGLIRERLDRALVNLLWEETYPCSQVQNIPAVRSNHSLLIMNIEYHDKKAPRKFKFEIVWAEMKECGEVIRKGWEYNGQGSKMFKLVQKLKGCRKKLKEWSRETIPNNRKIIEELTRRVADIQKEVIWKKDLKNIKR